MQRKPTMNRRPQTPWRRTAQRRLLAWYRRTARDLDWRRTGDPYAIWVSEVMLQQTQVATVQRYFPRFLAAFPTIAKLAAAAEDDVLRLWEGLGYYRRARQMHTAAKKIVAEHGGELPRDPETLCSLPGIGRYTAGAILSIAFDTRLPIVEANTNRLLSRLLALRGDTNTSAAQQLLWEAAESLLPVRGSGEMNQALMELGSLVCTPRTPRCEACPLESLCPTRRHGLQEQIPAARRPPKMESMHEAAVVIEYRGKILLRKCSDGERWAGLWDLPRFSLTGATGMGNGTSIERQVILGVRRLTGVAMRKPRQFAKLRHGVTRFRITLDGFAAQCSSAPRSSAVHGKLRWVKPQDLDAYPLNTTGRKLARLWRAQSHTG